MFLLNVNINAMNFNVSDFDVSCLLKLISEKPIFRVDKTD